MDHVQFFCTLDEALKQPEQCAYMTEIREKFIAWRPRCLEALAGSACNRAVINFKETSDENDEQIEISFYTINGRVLVEFTVKLHHRLFSFFNGMVRFQDDILDCLLPTNEHTYRNIGWHNSYNGHQFCYVWEYRPTTPSGGL